MVLLLRETLASTGMAGPPDVSASHSPWASSEESQLGAFDSDLMEEGSALAQQHQALQQQPLEEEEEIDLDRLPSISTSSSPLLEAFEKEIVFLVRDFGQDLREMVDSMKHSVKDKLVSAGSHSGKRYGGSRRRRRRGQTKSHLSDDPTRESSLPLMSSFQSSPESSYVNLLASHEHESMEKPEAEPQRENGLPVDQEIPKLSPSIDSTKSSFDQLAQPPLQHDWNMIDMDKHEDNASDYLPTIDATFLSSSDLAVENPDNFALYEDEREDPLCSNLVKKALTLPLAGNEDEPLMAEPTAIFMLEVPDLQPQWDSLDQNVVPPLKVQLQAAPVTAPPPAQPRVQARFPSKNPFAKLFRGRRVESVVSLWTVEQDGDTAEVQHDETPTPEPMS